MADRYWVGGTGTWNTTSTTNWAASSGGASGASAPTAADNVFFDSNSNVGTGAFTVTVSAAVCNDFTVGSPTALDGAMTLAIGASTLTVSGSWTNPATNFSVSASSGTITFNATTTGKTLTTNGVNVGANLTFNGVSGAWTLGSALLTDLVITLTNGTFDTSASNYAVTASSFSSNNSNVRTINLNSSTITLNTFNFVWVMTTSTNATLNAGTSTINFTSNLSASFAGGGLTYYNVSFTSTSSLTAPKQITGANTFNNLTFSTIGAAGLNNITIGANQTINGTFTVNGANGNQRQFVRSDTMGTSRTLTCAAIASTTDVDFRDITIAGAHGTLSGTRLGDCGGNSNITFVAGKTVYWSLVGGGNWNQNGWATSSGGGGSTINYPLPQDTAIIENTGLNTGATITINGSWNIGTLDASTRTNAMTLASSTNSPTFYGNLTYGSGVTPTGTAPYTFSNRATKTLNSGGKTFTQPVTIDAPGGGIQLLTNNLTLGSTLTTVLTRGTLDLNNLTLSTGTFSSSNSVTRSIAFGSTGSIVTTTTSAGTTVLDMSTATNFTFTGTSNISTAMSVTRVFKFGDAAGATAANRLNINLTSGASVPTFTGSFRQINFTGSTCNPGAQSISCHGFTLASGGTYTSTDFTTIGDGTLTSNGKTIDTLTVNGSGITTTLQDALTTLLGSGSATCTLTQGTLDLNGFTLTTSILSSSNTNTRAIAFGSTGSIVLGAQIGATNLSMATATNFTFTGTSNISAGMPVVRTFNFGSTAGATASNRLNINLTSGVAIPTFTGSFRQINFTGSTSNPGNQNISCHGFTLASGGTYTSTDFTTVGTGTLTSNGKAIDILNVNGSGITTTLADAGQAATLGLTSGTIDLAGFTFTVTSSAGTASGAKNLTFNGGTLVCSAASATAWNNANPTGFTTTAGTGTGTISMTAATAKTFVGGGSTYNCTLNQGGAGTLTITGANTFNDITETVPTANQITFPASTTTTVNNFTLSGSAGNLVSIRSSTSATQFTLSKASGTVNASFLDIQDSNATGGATWNALPANGNVNSGNNLGWDFGGVTYAVSVDEFATGLDAISLLLIRVGSVSETTQASEAQTTQLDAVGAVSETTRASEAQQGNIITSRAVSETTQASEAQQGNIITSRAVSETTRASDADSATLTASSAVSETTRASEVQQGNIETTSAVSETTQASDTEAATLTRVGAVDETATGADATTNQLDAFGGISETATAADVITNTASLQMFIDEAAIAEALAVGNIITTLQISEGATILDESLARLLWELINDNQLPGWQLVPNNQGSGWTIINTNTGTSWTNIDSV